MTEPLLADDALLAAIAAADSGEHHFHLWWLGQSGFLLAWNGHRMLFDPYLSDSLTRKYAATDKPHVRISRQVISPERLTGIQLVTASHIHTDHLDAETLVPLAAVNPGIHLVGPEAIESTIRERMVAASDWHFLPLDGNTTVHCGPFSVFGIPAAHNTVARDGEGRCLYLGFVVRFGKFAIYHSGDTLWHDSLVPRLLPHAVDVALVPINGNLPERRVSGNLNGTEAAALAKAIGARLAIPHHFDLFAFNTADPGEFTDACARLAQPARVLQLGQGLRFPMPS
jgi:L-ascorbate metabolism protein UlaG (beta-lactamase superfamily)